MGWITEGLDKASYDRSYKDKDLFKRIIRYFKPYRGSMLMVSLAVIITAVINASLPYLVAEMVDSIEFNTNNDVTLFVGIIGGMYMFIFIANALLEIFTARAIQGSVRDLRRDTFSALLQRDMSFFDKQPSGKLASRVTNDTYEFATTVSLTSSLVAQIFSVLFIILFLISRSVRLTVVTASFIPFVVLIALSYRKIARFVSLRSQRVIAKVNALIQETTTGISVAKSFRAESLIYSEFETMNKQNYKTTLRRQYTFISIYPVLAFVTASIVFAVVYFGALEVAGIVTSFNSVIQFIPGEPLSIGDWFMFYQAVGFFIFPLIQISSFWSQFQLGLAAAERTFSIMDTPNEIIQTDSVVLDEIKGEIEFKDLTFGYDKDIPVLNKFNLKIKAGEKLAIVGHTGAGKSTLGKLIGRYYEFQDGYLLIDGHNIRSLNLTEYRKKLSIITQDVILWNGTIRENLLYGVPNKEKVTDDDLKNILQKVEIQDWIDKLESGLDTHIGERGSKISMGQRQLLYFARILLQESAILIMDEATASVDPLTEARIQRVAKKVLENKTSIVIAHRLSTIRKVDRIIVLKDGNIIEEGSHDDLLQKGGHYADLYNTYFKHQSLSYIESMSSKN
ncbi:MAG: ABC transporter ATP-binding protein/permease [Candidatus Heimdallarchaeota archaeon]|nr:ABC transporter ATP-binding protein/permease [Candidatus Heimdallarchaeota archaeon]